MPWTQGLVGLATPMRLLQDTGCRLCVRACSGTPEINLLADALKPGAGRVGRPSGWAHSHAIPQLEGLHREQEEACTQALVQPCALRSLPLV